MNLERTTCMIPVMLYDEEGVEGIRCEQCQYTEIHDHDFESNPLPDVCPNCGLRIVQE